ncbi:MAG: hypothetical protein J2P37_31325 [Ktedonobacteraceae bacterium]|nr:hypothetical protein [Ktedonobacteraceae bacterium]
MIVKSKHVRASRTNRSRASSALKNHFKYLQYRERDPLRETKADRHAFSNKYDHVDRRDAHDAIMQREQAGDIYYHRLVLSPKHDEPVADWRAWTREVMADLEAARGQTLEWYAVQHRNTDNPHVHMVLSGTGYDRDTGQAEPVALSPHDFQVLQESGKTHSLHDHYQTIEETLRDLERGDTLTQEDHLLVHDNARESGH